jgi:hypothetical protein
MANKFKVNDYVSLMYDGTLLKGWITKLDSKGLPTQIERDDTGGWLRDEQVPSNYKAKRNIPRFYNVIGSSNARLLKRSGKAVKQKAVKFLLKYDLDEDPIEEFETMKEVNARIEELVADREDNGLQLDSIFIYEVKGKCQAIVETKATIELKKIS